MILITLGNRQVTTRNLVALTKVREANKILQTVHQELLPLKALEAKISSLAMGLYIQGQHKANKVKPKELLISSVGENRLDRAGQLHYSV